MEEMLEKLRIRELNPSFSTGINWASTYPDSKTRTIVSPVDAKKIASVQLISEDDYIMSYNRHKKHLINGKRFRLPRGVKSCVNWSGPAGT
jgi:hypothetical protein